MTDFSVSLDSITAAALVVIMNDAVSHDDRAVSALRRTGYTTEFLGEYWDQIRQRVREMCSARLPHAVYANPERWMQ